MIKLDGIAKLRGKIVELGDIGNPVLRRILSYRVQKENFNFHSEGYREHKDGFYRDSHTDKHSDNYTDSHRDNHSDYTRKGDHYADLNNHSDGYCPYSESPYSDVHTDSGYSETITRGHSDHTDSKS